ncbi:MAG TPA: hypothetical protein VFK24_08310 [Gammaproteobacteria bacterium]|nr:hypothetical protein [Gammaproteobacteria bacterium]
MNGLLGYYEGVLALLDDRIRGGDAASAETTPPATETASDETDLAKLIAASVEQVADSATPEELRAMRLDICTQALGEVARIMREPR